MSCNKITSWEVFSLACPSLFFNLVKDIFNFPKCNWKQSHTILWLGSQVCSIAVACCRFAYSTLSWCKGWMSEASTPLWRTLRCFYSSNTVHPEIWTHDSNCSQLNYCSSLWAPKLIETLVSIIEVLQEGRQACNHVAGGWPALPMFGVIVVQ